MSLSRQLAATADPVGLARWHTNGTYRAPPHIETLNRLLLDVFAGNVTRAVVSLHPRAGKSLLVSRYAPAWWLGRRPDSRVVVASYSDELAAEHGRFARDLLAEHGPDLFDVQVSQASRAADRWDIAGRDGGMVTVGVGSALTGRGADLLIVDDPHKDAAEVLSDTQRERVWEWFQAVVRTRLHPGGALLVVSTRWHQDDLIGRLKAAEEHGAEPYEHLRIPALAEAEGDPLGRDPGEPMWPDRYGLEELSAIRSTLGTRWWEALYQQNPRPPDGDTFRKGWLRRFRRNGDVYLLDVDDGQTEAVPVNACRRFTIADLAVSERTSADYTAVGTFAVTPNSDLLLLDMIRRRIPGPDQVGLLRAVYERHHPAYIGVETVAYQLSLLQEAQRDGLPVRRLTPKADKVARAMTAAARAEAGTIYLPKGPAWVDTFEDELLAFPHGKHDDQVDVLAYAALDVAGRNRHDPAKIAEALRIGMQDTYQRGALRF